MRNTKTQYVCGKRYKVSLTVSTFIFCVCIGEAFPMLQQIKNNSSANKEDLLSLSMVTDKNTPPKPEKAKSSIILVYKSRLAALNRFFAKTTHETDNKATKVLFDPFTFVDLSSALEVESIHNEIDDKATKVTLNPSILVDLDSTSQVQVVPHLAFTLVNSDSTSKIQLASPVHTPTTKIPDSERSSSTKELRLLNSSPNVEDDEIQVQPTAKTSGIQLSQLLRTNREKVSQSIRTLCNGEKADKSIETSFNIGFLVGKEVANLHKTTCKKDEESATTHIDVKPENVFVDLENSKITLIGPNRVTTNDSVDSIDADISKLLGPHYARYELSNVPYLTGFLKGYRSIFTEAFSFQTDWLHEAINTRQYLIHNIFYKNSLGGKGAFFSSFCSKLYAKNIDFKDTDAELFNELATAIGRSEETINFNRFAEVMRIIGLQEGLELTGKIISRAALPASWNARRALVSLKYAYRAQKIEVGSDT